MSLDEILRLGIMGGGVGMPPMPMAMGGGGIDANVGMKMGGSAMPPKPPMGITVGVQGLSFGGGGGGESF